MPRYYCDYCDTYLTHDSPSVRKQHNAGYKHKANVRSYYQQFEEQQTQSLIDQRIKEHLGQAAAFQNQVGASFNQHLISLQGNPQRPRLPVMMPPVMPFGARPPVLPRPVGAPVGMVGYGAAPPSMAPPGAPSSVPGQMTMPPSMAPPASNGANSMYQMNPSLTTTGVFNAYGAAPGAPPAASAPQDSRSYGQVSEQ